MLQILIGFYLGTRVKYASTFSLEKKVQLYLKNQTNKCAFGVN